MSDRWWTLPDIAAWAGIGERAAESRMRRTALPPDHRQPGRTGRNVWSPTAVRAAWSDQGWETPDARTESENVQDPSARPR